MSISYKDSGVNIDAGNEVIENIKNHVKSTFSKNVLTGIGGFGALFDIKEALKDYEHPILTQSIDGVGTKLMIAQKMNKWDTVGIDIVSNCAGDIVVMGAKPLTFLDYVAHEKLDPTVMETIMTGMCKACKESNISLIGGETAEMPGTYMPGEHDIAGCITGVVEKDKIITGENIEIGDVVLGFASNGLHTNGYSLARKLFFEIEGCDVNTKMSELLARHSLQGDGGEKSVGETLLEPHTNYTNPILDMLDSGIEIKGMAHITGGGLLENIPRILPDNCSVEIIKDSYPMLPVFEVMQKIGDIEESEMYRTFNMGVGMVLILDKLEADKIKEYNGFKIYEIGKVVEGEKKVNLI